MIGTPQRVERNERVQQTHPGPRKYLELIQDGIVFCLCAMLLVTMGIKLFHLSQLLIQGTDFSLVVGDILFILVLVELFRLLLIYLEEHRVSVATIVEVGIVATLREVFRFASLRPRDLAIAFGGGAFSVAWFEVVKLARSKRARTT